MISNNSTVVQAAKEGDCMKVMIMKCCKDGAWCNKSIGKTLDVVKELEEDYLIKIKDKKTEGNHIHKSNCTVIGR